MGVAGTQTAQHRFQGGRTRDQRTVTTARLVLFMEANHDPSLRNALWHGRAQILILHRIARHDRTDVRPVLVLVVRAALA